MDKRNGSVFTKGPAALISLVFASLLAFAFVFSLCGCSSDFESDEITKQAEDVASQAQELADTFSSIDYSKPSYVVVKDASTGEVVNEVTNQNKIEQAFSPLSGVNGLAGSSDASAEYVFELWQTETLKAGQDESDLEEIKALEVTTYKDSTTVTMEVCPINLKLDLAAQDGTVDALRQLAD